MERSSWPRWARVVGALAACASLVLLGVVLAFLDRRAGLTTREVPLLLCGALAGAIGFAGLLAGLVGASKRSMVGLIVAALASLGSAGYQLFIAFIIATFPKC